MAATASQSDDAHVRYVDEDGKVLYIQHQYTEIPKLGSERRIQDEKYRVTGVRHVYDTAVNTLRHVRLTVTPA